MFKKKVIDKKFTLIPFQKEGAPDLSCFGSVKCDSGELCLSYVFDAQTEGALSVVDWGDAVRVPSRKPNDDLWRRTCLECFFTAKGHADYTELNLVPSGDWNAYSFTGYREGMTQSRKVEAPRLQVGENTAVRREFSVCWPLSKGASASVTSFDVSVALVLRLRDGTVSYWSIEHKATKPDFHCRDSFVLSVPVFAG